MAPRAVTKVLAVAAGRAHRDDPALPHTGGPAGNAQLTAWVGLSLLPLFLVELVTLLSLDRLISWHIFVGVVLIPPALLKTVTTGWRILRYYSGANSYRQAGTPPLLLRLLGPLVVLTTLAVLGTGVILIVIGPKASATSLAAIGGQRLTVLALHQASSIAWATATGLHVLARLIPAGKLATTFRHGRGQPAGGRTRIVVLLATVAIGGIAAVIVMRLGSSWTAGDLHGFAPSSSAPGS